MSCACSSHITVLSGRNTNGKIMRASVESPSCDSMACTHHTCLWKVRTGNQMVAASDSGTFLVSIMNTCVTEACMPVQAALNFTMSLAVHTSAADACKARGAAPAGRSVTSPSKRNRDIPTLLIANASWWCSQHSLTKSACHVVAPGSDVVRSLSFPALLL